MSDPQTPEMPDMACNELVELVTDYLEGALTPGDVQRIDRHLEVCPGCRSVLAQWREAIRLTGRLAETEVDDLDPDTRARLMATFRRRRHG
jgi:predicted anti-sigma-YlaC factor YlaD